MREFRDNEGRPWVVAITVASAERVRGLVTVDVTEDVDQPDGSVSRQTRSAPFDIIDTSNIAQTLQVLRSQYGKVGEVLYAICRKQCEEKKLDREAFLDGLKGDAIEAGVKAIEEELVDFFPPRLRTMVGLLASRMTELADELQEKAEAGLKAATVEALLAQSGMPSGKPLASSASIPASGLSDNSSPLETAA
jgi:hypothetical protein